jgi:hypothetical protein
LPGIHFQILDEINEQYQKGLIKTPIKDKLVEKYFESSVFNLNQPAPMQEEGFVGRVGAQYRGQVNQLRSAQILEQQSKQKTKAFATKLPYKLLVQFGKDVGKKTFPNISGILQQVLIL